MKNKLKLKNDTHNQKTRISDLQQKTCIFQNLFLRYWKNIHWTLCHDISTMEKDLVIFQTIV
jgi:hypothetical protein